MKFECDECCKDCNETPDNINGNGQYCKKCIDKMFEEDMGQNNGKEINNIRRIMVYTW